MRLVWSLLSRYKNVSGKTVHSLGFSLSMIHRSGKSSGEGLRCRKSDVVKFCFFKATKRCIENLTLQSSQTKVPVYIEFILEVSKYFNVSLNAFSSKEKKTQNLRMS